MEQDSLPSFSMGLLLAHVPENSPSFLIKILMAMPANPTAKRPTLSNTTFHSMGAKLGQFNGREGKRGGDSREFS